MADEGVDELPLFSAVSSSARQLYLLLRCISFADKAHVQITEEGLRFSVEESSVMEGYAFLDKSLFSSYQYHAPSARALTPDSEDSTTDTAETEIPTFQISLPSLLETLQIFGFTDLNNSRPPWARENTSTAFSAPVLGINNLCRLTYEASGSPLTIILTEGSVRTTCALTTYEPAFHTDIPFARNELQVKIIMRASWLADAISELGSTGPERLTLVARMAKGKPYFALSASGPLGSARVEFNNTSTQQPPPTAPPEEAGDSSTAANLLETFQLADPSSLVRNTYKFTLVQKAARTMSAATKVSVRGDKQGVLSLQFMIEVEPQKVSFVDFRFVPFVSEEGDVEEGERTMLGEEGEEESTGDE